MELLVDDTTHRKTLGRIEGVLSKSRTSIWLCFGVSRSKISGISVVKNLQAKPSEKALVGGKYVVLHGKTSVRAAHVAKWC